MAGAVNQSIFDLLVGSAQHSSQHSMQGMQKTRIGGLDGRIECVHLKRRNTLMVPKLLLMEESKIQMS